MGGIPIILCGDIPLPMIGFTLLFFKDSSYRYLVDLDPRSNQVERNGPCTKLTLGASLSLYREMIPLAQHFRHWNGIGDCTSASKPISLS
jgi:hypothetical protein